MPLEIVCPGCGRALKVPDVLAGKKGKCPACGRVIDIPETAAPAGVFRADEEIGLPGTAAPPEEPAAAPPRAGLFPAGEKTGLPGEMEEKKEEPPPAQEEPAATLKDSGRAAVRFSLTGASLKYARADSFVKGEDSHPVLDLSAKGVGFKLVLKPKKRALQTAQLKPDVSPGDMLNLTVDIQAFVTTMKLRGRVTRVVPMDEKNAYLVGVEFTEVPPGDAERLKKLEGSQDLRRSKRAPRYI